MAIEGGFDGVGKVESVPADLVATGPDMVQGGPLLGSRTRLKFSKFFCKGKQDSMNDLIYSMGVSLDGYVEDAQGGFDWAAPDDEVHSLANQQARQASAFVFGRRMFETLDEYWIRAAEEEGLPPIEAEFAAAYAATPRYVVSDTLAIANNGATLVPRAEGRPLVERLKAESGTHVEIGGPEIAASLMDLIDEFRMWMNPVAVGGGKPFFPAGAEQLNLELVECRNFPSGILWLRYRRA